MCNLAIRKAEDHEVSEEERTRAGTWQEEEDEEDEIDEESEIEAEEDVARGLTAEEEECLQIGLSFLDSEYEAMIALSGEFKVVLAGGACEELLGQEWANLETAIDGCDFPFLMQALLDVDCFDEELTGCIECVDVLAKSTQKIVRLTMTCVSIEESGTAGFRFLVGLQEMNEYTRRASAPPEVRPKQQRSYATEDIMTPGSVGPCRRYDRLSPEGSNAEP